MISDVLSDAVSRINDYLTDSVIVYSPAIQKIIVCTVEQMEATRKLLDSLSGEDHAELAE